ncbi:unnamed protein product [Brugia timori]|uniref:Fibronectin type-III domain-containing protein n=1 Tax=Brugia timori TaxID=42155 RepID=A0A3P7Z1N2_9BILA|nr:unnamed protein product [Brugia timori]
MHTRKVRTEQVPGSFFSSILSQLSPYSIYNVSVRAGTDFGELGAPIFKVISLQGNKDDKLSHHLSDEEDRLKQQQIEQQKQMKMKEESERNKFEREQIEEEERKRNRIKECERKRLQMEYDRLNRERERNRVTYKHERPREHLKYEHIDRATQQQQEYEQRKQQQYYERQQQLERERMELYQRQQWEREREQWEKERERNHRLIHQRQEHDTEQRRNSVAKEENIEGEEKERLELEQQQLDHIQVLPETNNRRGDIQKPLLGIDKPRIEQRGSRILLYWTVGGDTSNVIAYQIDLRSDSDNEWKTIDGYLSHSPSEIHFRQELINLETNKHYYVKVSAIDQSRRILATSEATSFTVHCQVPNSSPQDLRLENVAEGIQLTWNWSDEENHECESYFLITGYQNGVPFSERVTGRQRQFTFRNTNANEWHVEMRAGNRAGTGPSSGPVNLQSNSKGIVQFI